MKLPADIELTGSPGKLLIQCPCVACHLAAIRDVVRNAALQAGFPADEVAQIELAVDEACSNIIEHGYGADLPGSRQGPEPGIRIEIRTEDDRLVIEITDHGRGFDGGSYRPKEMQVLMQEGKTGGYGVSIIRRCMDEVVYGADANAANTLRLVKYLKRPGRHRPSPGADRSPAV